MPRAMNSALCQQLHSTLFGAAQMFRIGGKEK